MLARGLCAVGREVLEPSSPGLRPGATPSQLPAQQKNPVSLVTPGSCVPARSKAKCHKRKGCTGRVFAGWPAYRPMHLGSPVILDLNEVIALLATGGIRENRPTAPAGPLGIDAARLEKVHRFFVPRRSRRCVSTAVYSLDGLEIRLHAPHWRETCRGSLLHDDAVIRMIGAFWRAGRCPAGNVRIPVSPSPVHLKHGTPSWLFYRSDRSVGASGLTRPVPVVSGEPNQTFANLEEGIPNPPMRGPMAVQFALWFTRATPNGKPAPVELAGA